MDHQSPRDPSGPPSLGLVQSDLKSDCCEYQDLQSANRISNAYIHCGRIANPPERGK